MQLVQKITKNISKKFFKIVILYFISHQFTTNIYKNAGKQK